MTEIGFYHLTRSKLQEALPKLLGRVLDAGGRGFILCGDAERARALDAALWLPARRAKAGAQQKKDDFGDHPNSMKANSFECCSAQ